MVVNKDKVFQMRTSEAFLRRIDNWRRVQDDLPSRTEAIRRLVEIGLEASHEGRVAGATMTPADNDARGKP